jgi:hypothetical protein
MNTVLSWRQRSQHVLTAFDEKLAQSSWMKKAEFLVVGITVPTLVVLAAWLGSALGASQKLSQGLAMILGLGLVYPFMQREMRCFTRIDADGILCTSPTPPATVVPSSYAEADYEGSCGQMANLGSDELDFLTELVEKYLEENDDLSQREWGFAKGVQDKLEEALNG